MVRIEMIFALGLAFGVVLGVLGSHLVRGYLARRDARLMKTRVDEALQRVETPELLNELSKRDDLGEKHR